MGKSITQGPFAALCLSPSHRLGHPVASE